jgi:DNA polymerase-4
MTEAAHRRLLVSGRAARTVTVKVRSADFSTSSRSETAGSGSTDLDTLTAVAQRLARAAVPEGGVRLIGVSLAGLIDDPPPALFEPARLEAVPAEAPAPEPGDPGQQPTDGSAAMGTIARPWRPGDDVRPPKHGHGWVQGAGHGRVTVRFETCSTGPGRARTFAADDPDLVCADPLGSLD